VSYLIEFLMSLGARDYRPKPEKQEPAAVNPPAHTSNNSSSRTTAGTETHQDSSSSENELNKRPGEAAYVIGNADHGRDIFELKCASCHGPQGTDKVPNPGSDDGFVPALNPIDQDLLNKDPQAFAKNIDTFIQHGSVPSGPNPQFHMLDFGDDHILTQQQIANVEAYILHLNGVDRAELINPGMKPVRFFSIVVPAVIVILLLLGGIYKCLPQGK
jgi:mono/diheme cytochrome c family protein